METLHTSQLTAFTYVATNLCDQLLAFQHTISSREEGTRYPTIDEANMQNKLINNLMRVQRQINMLYKLENPKTKPQSQPLPTQQEDTALVAAFTPPIHHDPHNIYGPAPISQDDFEIHKYELKTYTGDNDAIPFDFNGKAVDRPWFMYNLFQYQYEPAYRRFVPDELDYYSFVNHKNTITQIQHAMALMQQHKTAA